MPPKKKSADKKPANPRTPTLINGLTKDEMSKEQLEEHIMRLREELDREREERNYFQLERDKIHSFWEITVRKQKEVDSELQKVEKDVEENEARHQLDVKVYKQKIKHLQHEHLNDIAELNADSLASNELMEKEQEHLEEELHKTITRVDIQEINFKHTKKELELKHGEELTTRSDHLEKQLAEITVSFEMKVQALKQDLDNIWKSEISDSENHWNSHIAALKQDHDETYRSAEEFVIIMKTDTDTLTELKGEINEAKKKHKTMKLEVVTVLKENKHLAELISKIKEENDEIAKKLRHYSGNKDVIGNIKRKKLKDLKAEHEVLEQKFSELQLERDELRKAFTEIVEKAQHNGDIENMTVEKKLQALTESLEETEAQLSAVLSASNMDQTALSRVIKKTEAHIDSKNTAIKTLQHKINQISMVRKHLLLHTEVKAKALGVPVEELLCNSQ
ncbi:dynein regulatory complex subunit 4-like isoform X1 [Simochromis diagramma]|uniref:dynein regulatory complex subunit 4-like isoform X1 n=2 Tax=Simochromis diagramma TaxID=43689 RepID=UPI001A7EAAD1|nr:dynein regulatory complex subunit 4-like isoform X1 [Simochromis diagramma]XP_039866687.1 dynein regulatory complex subunit 4-like isoform X1 [Simochromis diagramma]